MGAGADRAGGSDSRAGRDAPAGPAEGAGAGPGESAGTDDSEVMDAKSASAILEDARRRADRSLVVRFPALFTVWAVAWLVIFGTIWLSVRDQRPFSGPTPAALLTLTLVTAAAVAVTVIVGGRAASGVGGSSALQRRILGASYVAGYAGIFLLEAAIDHAGASRAVLGVYGAAAPVLLIGLILAARSAARLEWPFFWLGLWLIVVAAGSGFAGPVTVWAVIALAGSVAFLVTAAGLRRSHA